MDNNSKDKPENQAPQLSALATETKLETPSFEQIRENLVFSRNATFSSALKNKQNELMATQGH
jgi:hypothetical protein